MAKGNYEISARLTIDNKRAKKTLTDTTKQISELNKMNNKFIDSEKKKAQVQKEIKKEQDKVNKAYKTGSGAVNKLVSGLNHENRANKQLVNSIKNTHVALTRHNASTEKYVGTMQKLASANGLAFRNGTFVDSLKDINLKTTTVGKTTENTTKAINDFSKSFNNLRKSLKGNENNLGNFEKGIRDLRQRMYRDYKVSVSSGANGVYSFTDAQTKEAQKSLALMNKYSKSLNNSLNKAFSVQRYTPNLSALTNGINSFRLGNSGLNTEINNLNNKLIKQNATVKEADKAWSDFAKSRGLVYKNNKLYSHMKDEALNIKTLGANANYSAKSTMKLNSAINEFKTGYGKLQSQLHKGLIDQTRFNTGINDLSKGIKDKYKVSISSADKANYTFSNSLNNVQLAMNQYTKALAEARNKIRNGIFSKQDALNLQRYRDNLGQMVLGQEKYNNLLKNNKFNTYKYISKGLMDNHAKLNVTGKQVEALNGNVKNFNKGLQNVGGSLSMVANKTGNYNKLLTTTTRSQRMQNYAMQVSAMRYNAVGTMAGFVGGMLVTQLAMGFAEARIEAVKFEQQAQQMLKTSRMNVTQQKKLTNAVKEYTRANRKINTQGLEYTVSQVAKLNNLTEEQAEKSIPVIADITNMMQINGRTQEDAILAVNDALDGQFKRLQEIGVQGKEQLKGYGWTGKLNDTKDVNSLLDALQKIGEKKGWHDLTVDVTTLDDAYRVLGNTIDDFLTPAVTSVTPVIVKMVEGISGFLGVLTKAPVPIQGLAGAIMILSTAFGKMQLEMLKARFVGSEFIARLTGLDDGMYGIRRSVGAVNLALQDNMLTFEEATRCLMDYHTETIGATNSFRSYNEELIRMGTLEDTLNTERVTASAQRQEQIDIELENLAVQREEMASLMQMDYAYAQYDLAIKNLSVTQQLELQNIMRLTSAREAEIAQIIIKEGLINGETGAIDMNTLATRLNVGEQYRLNSVNKKTAVSNRLKADSTRLQNKLLRINNTLMRKSTVSNTNKSKALYGLVPTQKINNDLIKQHNVVEKISNNLYKNGNANIKKKISAEKAETIIKGALNKVTKNCIIVEKEEEAVLRNRTLNLQRLFGMEVKGNTVKSISAVKTEAEAVAEGALTTEIELNTIARRLNNNSILSYVKGLEKSAVATTKNAGSMALQTAEFMLFTPEGWALDAVLGAIALTAYDLAKHQLDLSDSLKKYYNLVDDGETELKKLDKQLSKLKKGTSDYNDVLARRNQLEEDYEKSKALNKYVDKTKNKSMGRIDKVGQKYEEIFSKKGVDFDYSGISSAEQELEHLADVKLQFSANAKKRTDELYKSLKNSGKTDVEIKNTIQDYLKLQADVENATDKMASEDMMERLGGYWDNWWARMGMQWSEFFNGADSWLSNLNNYIDDINNSIGDFTNWINESLSNFTIENFINWINESLAGFDIVKIIQDALFPKAVSAEDGSNSGGGLSHEDWIRFIGIDPTTLPQEFSDAINNFGSTAWNSIYNFGNGIYTNFMNGLGDLGKIINDKINDIINSILNAPAKIATDAWNFGKSIYTNFKKGLGDLGKIVTDEINEIGQAILDAPKNIAQSAWNFGKAIVDGVNKEVDHHSPGTIARWIRDDVNYINDFLKNGISSSGSIAQTYGRSIVDNFGEVELTPKTNTKGVISDNNAIMSSTYEAQKYTANEYNTMTNNVTDAFGIMSNTANSDMNSVAMNNAKYLVKMNNDTKTNMTQIQTTNNGKLQAMQSSTLTATNSMSKAWGSMKNSIVNCASQIRTQSYSKFESLHRTISSFYNQIQNAHFGTLSAGYAGGAGGATVPRVRRPSVRRSSLNTSSNKDSLSGLQIEGNFFDLLPKMKKVIGEDILIKMMNGLGDNYSAGINVGAVANKHTNKILDSAKRWKIKSPKFLGVTLPSNYTVGDFLNGNAPSNPLNGDFESVLTSICTEKGFRNPDSYQLYFNSKKSNQEVWDSVRCNCYDGAEMILAIANMLGLSGHLINGHWGSIAHTGAMVNGKLFDMTQFQKRGVWRGTSGVNFAGSPDTGKRIKWSSAGKGKLVSGGTTNNSNSNVVHVTITGNTFIGEKDYKKQMKSIAEDVFYDNMSINPCTGI